MHIRFVIDGKFDTDGTNAGSDGFTVVAFRPDQTTKYKPVNDLAAAAKLAIKPTL